MVEGEEKRMRRERKRKWGKGGEGEKSRRRDSFYGGLKNTNDVCIT